jgi:sarcosine oxidase subunit beta
MTSFDVAVVGGGVNGASAAFYLTRLGVRRVVLLERGPLAAGASGKSGALVRMHYGPAPPISRPFRSTRFAEGRPWVDAHHYGRKRLTVSR